MAKVTKESRCKAALEAYENFINLCKYFFSGNGSGKVKDIPNDSPFQKTAVEIAKEEGIDWNNMTDEDNDYMTVVLLEEAYTNIRQMEDKNYVIDITIKEEKKDGPKEDSEHTGPAD